jgi:hypothetical protein
MAAQMTGWPTPIREDSSSSGRHGRVIGGKLMTLTDAARMSGWAHQRVTGNGNHGSPARACDGRARLQDQVHGAISNGSPAATAKPGQLNPEFSLWLMGYPAEWDACAPVATRSSRKSPPSS